MSGCVLDSSFAVAAVLQEDQSAHARRILSKFEEGLAFVVPFLWWFEVGNALLVGERRGRLTEADAIKGLELLKTLPIETVPDSGFEAMARWRFLGSEHGLTVYDAAYLELAARRKMPLATVDRALAKAALRAGVKVLD